MRRRKSLSKENKALVQRFQEAVNGRNLEIFVTDCVHHDLTLPHTAEDKMAEGWVNFDALVGMMQQPGVVPTPEQSGA